MTEAVGLQSLRPPANGLSRADLAEVAAGALVLAQPTQRFAAPSLGLRFNVDNQRFLLALTSFHARRSPVGCAIGIIDAELSG